MQSHKILETFLHLLHKIFTKLLNTKCQKYLVCTLAELNIRKEETTICSMAAPTEIQSQENIIAWKEAGISSNSPHPPEEEEKVSFIVTLITVLLLALSFL
jgi:hypothetical protein